MQISFGSIIPINGVYIINNKGYGNYKYYLRFPSVSVFQTLTRRINAKKDGYYDKLAEIDADLRKTPYSASVYNGAGERFFVTGKAAQDYRNVTGEHYRTNSSYQQYDKQNQVIFSKEKQLLDKMGEKVYLDIFVTQNKNNKYELKSIDLVNTNGKKSVTSFEEKDGQLLLPL